MPSLVESGRLLFKFAKGALSNQLTLDRMQSIVEAINMNRITGVVGGSFSRSKDGTTIIVKAGKGGGVSSSTHPFKISTRRDTDTNSAWYSVFVGTLNNVVPTTDDYIDGDLELWEETARGSSPEKGLPATTSNFTRYIYVELDYGTGLIAIQDYATARTAPYDATGSGIGRVQIGRVAYNSTSDKLTIVQLVKGNLSLFAYRDAEVAFVNEY